jgi:hypothetical protein
MVFFVGCKGKPEESIVEVKNGDFKVDIRTQEFHHSGIRNVDVCIAESAHREFPKNKSQCVFHGYDFNKLSVKWQSQRVIEISFDCGRVDMFRNSAFVYPGGPVPEEFYITLSDTCNT